jgi:hypothetical protein
MSQPGSDLPIEGDAELREINSRLQARWGSVLDDGQTPCCYAITRHHVLLRALEKLLDLFPKRSSTGHHKAETVSQGQQTRVPA